MSTSKSSHYCSICQETVYSGWHWQNVHGKFFGRTKLGWADPRTAPTLHPTMLEIAWAAGIFEGEGSSNRGSTEMVRVGQKDKWLVERLRDLFGGKIYFKNGHATAPSDGVLRIWQSWQWYLAGARARGFLMTIYPYLSPWRQAQTRRTFGLRDAEVS